MIISRRHDIAGDIDSLKTDLFKLRRDLGHLAGTVVQEGRTTAEGLKETVQSGMEGSLDTVHYYVKRWPLASLSVAVGIGLMAGMLIPRR
jgi:ElaB/YqjD/DUF883 family membrane-anchored ribosome-binding protein